MNGPLNFRSLAFGLLCGLSTAAAFTFESEPFLSTVMFNAAAWIAGWLTRDLFVSPNEETER